MGAPGGGPHSGPARLLVPGHQGGGGGAFPAEGAGLVIALLTGDKSGLSSADYDALRRAGLAHAVAVSGLHMGFLVQLAVALTGSRYRRRTALVVLPLMLCYVLMVGGTPSVVRAAVMNGLLLLVPCWAGRMTPPPACPWRCSFCCSRTPTPA